MLYDMLYDVLCCVIPIPHEAEEGGAGPRGGLRQAPLVGGSIELSGEVSSGVGKGTTGGRGEERGGRDEKEMNEE